MTGQREFFLKKLVRGIKNVVKKVAPIVLPVALNFLFPGMGTIAAGALGSGIGTLIQGGNVRDAFRNALIGGAVGGLYSGVSGAMSGQGFMSGVRQGFTGTPGMGFFELNPSVRGMFGGAGAAPAGGSQLQTTMSSSGAPAAGSTPPAPVADVAPGAERTLGQRALDFIMPKPAMTQEALTAEAGRLAALNPNIDATAIYNNLVASQPSAMARFAGPALLAGGAAALAGAFNPVEQEAPPTPGYEFTSQELLARNPQLYSVGTPVAPNMATYSDIAVPTSYASAVPAMAPINIAPIQLDPIRFAAAGGEMESFPRRMGAIAGPGTETSDDVPAMLSDGEFVMTARAVRGAGNGDRQQGVRRMYDMMRMFEGGVAR
jgi:hypothetical protein